jgi:hypothetical protein
MVIEQMASRCPSARYLDKAVLRHYEFRICVSGYATIVLKSTASVHGIVWLLQHEDETALDLYEEVAEGLYRKVIKSVELNRGGRVRALVYEAVRPAVGRACPGYIEPIVQAAVEHGFPPDAIAQLSRWRPI